MARKKKAEPDPKGDEAATTETKDKSAAATVRIICNVASGRRRGPPGEARRWPGGETVLPADEISDEMRAALDADPMFQVIDDD